MLEATKRIIFIFEVMGKYLLVLKTILLLSIICYTSHRSFANDRTNANMLDTTKEYLQNKKIPEEFRKPILKALSHFPELKNLRIEFEIKKVYTPLSTSPSFGSMIKRKSSRTYIVTISDQSIDTLNHLLFKNLSFVEQVGIIGHELSHVVDFDRKNFFQSCGNAFGHLSKTFLDRMEYKTDLICIQHGLGRYLEAYSLHVRQSMHVTYWRGVDHVFEKNDHIERYMNPDTIEKYMSTVATSPIDSDDKK